MVGLPPILWNLTDGMVNRTINALERYNRRLNDLFANAPPNRCSFTEIIKDEFLDFEEKYAECDISTGIRHCEALLQEFNIYLVNN
ncbi:hypothetical protein HZS_1784 [Henneguya salminicola]|nr:hypothetical protein HZS_1784 [Henneguya salminicola]